MKRRTFLMGGALAAAGTAEAGSYVNERDPNPEYAGGAASWLMTSFGHQLTPKFAGSRIPLDVALAMAYQESGYTWWHAPFRQSRTPQQILRLLVLDAHEPRGKRTATGDTIYPHDTATFMADSRWTAIAPGLLAAGEASRDWRGLSRTGKLMFGYGLFQNDLQNIENPQFTRFWTSPAPPVSGMDLTGQSGLWGDVGVCADMFSLELLSKFSPTRDIWSAVRAYNGTGKSADVYVANVRDYATAIRAKLAL